jgi:hypothetical protein
MPSGLSGKVEDTALTILENTWNQDLTYERNAFSCRLTGTRIRCHPCFLFPVSRSDAPTTTHAVSSSLFSQPLFSL